MSDVQRRPALGKRVDPIEASIPEQPPAQSAATEPEAARRAAPDASGRDAALNTVLNTRIRQSTRSRLELAVNKLRFERNDRSISLSSLTDQALDSFLSQLGL